MHPSSPTWSLWEIPMGALLLILATLLHGLGMYLVHARFDRHWPDYEHQRVRRQFFFGVLVFLILVTHLAEVLMWAITLRSVGAITGFRDAFYYAAVTYTTLGYNSEMLPSAWRILAPMIAMSGLFAFGWTTGVLVSMVRRMHDRDRERGSDPVR
jgi:uncharacterized membrane protein SpoIIM required for sporulation